MTLTEAYNKVKNINKSGNFVAKLKKHPYKNYDVEIEPYELAIIKASLNTINHSKKGFYSTYKAKYE